MMEFIVSPRSQDNWDSSQAELQTTSHQRLECPICNYRINPNQESAFVLFPCNVRAFRNESFKVWQCPSCGTIHCLDVVNLEHYYAQYPFGHQILSFPLRLCYHNLLRKLKKQNFSKSHSLLDYGCGSGQFVQYLQQQGFINSYGYDPYAELEGFGNPIVLQQAPFDYILLQDVVEHVEDPNKLFYELNTILAPGGYILIGTPNASRIDLTKPHVSDYYNSVHTPYHLHIYTDKSIELLGRRQGWEVVNFFDRPYHDTFWFGLNARAWNEYQRTLDDTINVIFEPIQYWKALTSYKFIFFAIFGYWLSLKTEMTIMFCKTRV
jgi:2-polyprenyl-3-methyl-5-hydroxy-6-metoxy-1,4-benzoquinol methylase